MRGALIGLTLLVAALCLATAPARAAGLDPSIRERVALSVVQVQARGCQGQDRAGTGFAYGPENHVVTALHVVAGCQRISVYWEKHGGLTQQAFVARVLNGADLALLQANGAPGQPLPAEFAHPQANAELEAVGYYLAVPTMDNKPLRVTFGSAKLRDMLPPSVREELRNAGAIDLEMDVVRMDGHLLPGLSGAPIVDLRGRVVAIGSGGLKNGAASVSWGVPARHLQALLQSAERPRGGDGTTRLFSSPVLEPQTPTPAGWPSGPPSPDRQMFTCGGVQFVHTGIRTFHELTVGHEDLQSIRYLISESQLTEADLAAFRYHTYQPVAGGAAVAIPEWASIQSSGGSTCQATGLDGRMTIDFAAQPVANFAEAQMASVRFENDYAARSNRLWMPYQPYSYIGPVQRADGLVANRRTYIAFQMDGSASLAVESLLSHQPPQARTANFTGVIGAYWDFDLQAFTYCSERTFDPSCRPYREEEKRVTQMVLGVFLATAPLI